MKIEIKLYFISYLLNKFGKVEAWKKFFIKIILAPNHNMWFALEQIFSELRVVKF